MKKILYKYLTNERLSFFENRLLRFTQPSCFNDPFEFLPVEDFLTKGFDDFVFKKYLHSKKFYDSLNEAGLTLTKESHLIKMKKEMLEFTSGLQNSMIGTYDNLGIFCLSANWNNVLMWSHYADNHKGFVIGFDTDHPYFKYSKFNLKPVHYTNKRPTSSPSDDFIKNLIYTKADIWSYENEWRICKEANEATKTIFENIHLFEFPTDSIYSIHLGSRSDNDMRNAILKRLSNWESPPKVYQTFMHTKEYKLIENEYSNE